MNYLGHIYLSGNDELLMVGNFIGDYVKGNQYNSFPDQIRQGILFHRAIDHFTDQNEHWLAIRELLRPFYHRYAGVVADIFIDHFLAKNWNLYSDTLLTWYAKWAYAAFLRHHQYLPAKVQEFLPYLIQHRRLQSYAYIEGLEMSLRIMSFRTSLPENTDAVIEKLIANYQLFEQHAETFLKEITAKRVELLPSVNLG